MRFAFIQAEKANYPVRLLCELMGVSRSGFYASRKRPPSRRASEAAKLSASITSIFIGSRRTYGSPRILAELQASGAHHGRKRIARLMREQGLTARRRRRFVRTTDSRHDFPVAPNVLARRFDSPEPDSKWATDITYIPTAEGWLYLAVVLDLFSRFVVGWSMSHRIDAELTKGALDMAIQRREPKPGALHHSDRGTQYASHEYRKALLSNGFLPSMSRKGNCWDNACVESFFSSLKTELIHDREFRTRDEARAHVFDYIEVFYNQQRRHSALGYLPPAEYERRHTSALAA